MPPNPKRPGSTSSVRSHDYEDEQILKADDPRPQRVAQYPSSTTGTRRPLKKAEEAIPTALYDTEADQEMQAQYGVSDEFKPAFLYVEKGPGQGQLLEVKQGTVVIGRASVSDLRLQHPSISRRHAQVKRVGEQFFIKDLGSQNGTFVNKERINGEVECKPGDSIALGNALVRLRGPLTKEERGEKEPKAEKKAPVANDRSNKARIATAVVSRPSGPQTPVASNALKVAVFAGAVGFGLAAALAFGLIKAMSGNTNGAAVTAEASRTEKDKLIDDALKRKMAEGKRDAPQVNEAAPEPEVDSDAPVVTKDRAPVVRQAAAPVVAQQPRPVAAAPTTRRPAPAPAPTADDEGDSTPAPTAGKGSSRAQLLAAYEKGNAEGSLDAAKRAGDKDLVGKLTNFIQAYDAANDAMMANNGTAAILNFQKALTLDEGLSSGWGRYGGEIRKKLASLYVLVGLQHSSNGDDESAKRAYQAALKHDPTNERAKNQLEKLGVSSPKSSADDAFDDSSNQAAKPRKPINPGAPAKKQPAAKPASIDDAFGD
jgi:pSer/pThr/pTyr-binding forkhead associated (FHA) protein